MTDILLTECTIEDKDVQAEKEAKYRLLDKDTRKHMHTKACDAARAGEGWKPTTTEALIAVMRENNELAD